MGFFRKAKNQFTKNEASVVIKDAIISQSSYGIEIPSPLDASRSIVERVWNSCPSVFDGTVDVKPSHISVAASALAHALDSMKLKEDYQALFALCLSKILNGISEGRYRYSMNRVDEALIDRAITILSEYSDKSPPAPWESTAT